MSYAIPAAIEMPELSITNEKPVGNVKIDWSQENSLLNGLLGYFLLGKDGQAVNLVTGIAYPYVGGITDIVYGDEQAASFDGASGTYIPIFSHDFSTGFSMYGKQRFNNASVDSALGGCGSGINQSG